MRLFWSAGLLLVGVTVAVAACSGDGTGLDSGNDDDVTLSGDVQPILTASCALSGCHAGTSPAQGQNLSSGQTFSNVVGVASAELPSMNRVTAGAPDNSYLVHKIQGTHLDVGGSGARMPFGRTALPQDAIDVIRAWIQDGAANN